MEYLVTMTTQVPEGTSDQQVEDMRAREAAHTRELAAEGRVLRLWRPPLGPGEWRTLGLFSADGPEDLERTLASMPLRLWRTDEPVALAPHADDPGPGTVPLAIDDAEFLVTFDLRVPPDTDPQAGREPAVRETLGPREPSAEGRLVRLWTLPGQDRGLGLWQAPDADTLRELLSALPAAGGRLTADVLPLTRHPSDPATARRVG